MLISGTGRNTGKTTVSCKLIDAFKHLQVVAVKISPHFHKQPNNIPLAESKGKYQIFKETLRNTGKDSSRMLDAGASSVFYIQCNKNSLPEAFKKVNEYISATSPVICESGGLSGYIKPGLHILMHSGKDNETKKLSETPDIVFEFSPEKFELNTSEFSFTDGKWIYKNLAL